MARSNRGELSPPGYGGEVRGARLNYLDFTERDVTLLRDLEELVLDHLDEIVEQFYRHLWAAPQTRAVLKDRETVERLKLAQKAYLLACVRGPYDEEYFRRRWHIGYVHNIHMLEPHWFIGAFQLYHRILYPLIAERYGQDPQALTEHILALDKIMNLDEQLGLESYMAHYVAAMDRLHALNLEIQAASVAKSQFLANMSHELRTPLNSVIGFAEVLLDGIAGPLNDEQGEYLHDIHKAGHLLLRLINDVLDLAKVEAGRLDLFHERFPVSQVLRDSAAALRGLADAKGLELVVDVPPDLDFLNADQLRFKQILNNLLSNAIKFTDQGRVTLSARREDGALHITVADTGIGIRPEDQARIFEEFIQVYAGHDKQYEGTGLGLALTRRLVEAHGGRIWVDSEFGAGSVFHVSMPIEGRSGAGMGGMPPPGIPNGEPAR